MGLERLREEFLLPRSSSHGVFVRRGTAQASYAASLCMLRMGISASVYRVDERIAAFGTTTVLDAVEDRSVDTLTDLGRDGSYLKTVSE